MFSVVGLAFCARCLEYVPVGALVCHERPDGKRCGGCGGPAALVVDVPVCKQHQGIRGSAPSTGDYLYLTLPPRRGGR